MVMQSCESASKDLLEKPLAVDFGAAPAETTLGLVDFLRDTPKSSSRSFFDHLLATESTHHYHSMAGTPGL